MSCRKEVRDYLANLPHEWSETEWGKFILDMSEKELKEYPIDVIHMLDWGKWCFGHDGLCPECHAKILAHGLPFAGSHEVKIDERQLHFKELDPIAWENDGKE
tara:strand:- start:231 stop:539 length:309 start_codon:yes stop_codon:yes gene_type:complete